MDQKYNLLYFSASQLTLYILEELSPSSVFVGCSISATESKGQKTMAIYFKDLSPIVINLATRWRQIFILRNIYLFWATYRA